MPAIPHRHPPDRVRSANQALYLEKEQVRVHHASQGTCQMVTELHVGSAMPARPHRNLTYLVRSAVQAPYPVQVQRSAPTAVPGSLHRHQPRHAKYALKVGMQAQARALTVPLGQSHQELGWRRAPHASKDLFQMVTELHVGNAMLANTHRNRLDRVGRVVAAP